MELLCSLHSRSNHYVSTQTLSETVKTNAAQQRAAPVDYHTDLKYLRLWEPYLPQANLTWDIQHYTAYS